jgi:predicted nuclease of predicted toxin-antitoxin system
LKQGKARFRVLLDAGVPDSVGAVLEERGHIVIYHRNVLPEKTPDLVVAATALANDAVLVAIDNDMKQLAQRYGMTARGDKFARLSIIRLCCNETLAAQRLRHAMTFVEHEWAIAEEKAARRMWVEIRQHDLRTYR